MQSIPRAKVTNCENVMISMLSQANQEGQQDKAYSVSIRLNALAIIIVKNQLSPAATSELLMKEAAKYEAQAVGAL
ncbi:DUF2732 family protein [Pantoea sp. SORGH_AS_0659]|uniref:DUF2732 family protein n=1 Tax=Pantoea sp. SORGH_AS_0659 TaxID=3062597 RepID=UPI00285DCAAB|nr:DUF2732 family protein [Pantoea sp. SORGH_AS_0659]MDR6348504.1 hypothetical protein [Pantoea sp. SORGH_AS_0659]